jgi:hypothetical protein
LVPQAAFVFPARHCVPLQQPAWQSDELQYATHWLFWHSLPAAHDWHVSPAVPQLALVFPGKHCVPSQQPDAQSDESQ